MKLDVYDVNFLKNILTNICDIANIDDCDDCDDEVKVAHAMGAIGALADAGYKYLLTKEEQEKHETV